MPHLHWFGHGIESGSSQSSATEYFLIGERWDEPLHLVVHLKLALFPQDERSNCTNGLGH